MPVRRSLIIPLALVLGLTLAGCGDDTKDDAATTTTVAGDGGSDETTTTLSSADTLPTEDTQPTTTLSADEFDDAVAASKAELAAAGDDFCKVAQAANTLIADSPKTPEQAKALYEVYAGIFTRIAETAPAGSEADGATLKAAAAKMLTDAEAGGYDPAGLASSEAPPAFAEPGVADAMSKIGDVITSTCLGETTVPAEG